MKRLLLSTVMFFAVSALIFGQGEVLFNDFTGALDPENIWGWNDPDAGNIATVSIEDEQLKSEYNWSQPSWFPRAVWYGFDDYVDCSESSILEIKFMVEDNDNELIMVRFDLYGDSFEQIDGAIQDTVETNGNPWEIEAENGVWYTEGSDFEADDRWYCTYWNGGIDATRVDSSRIQGFQAFTNYGGADPDEPGTLYIDYIKLTDVMTGVERYLVGGNNAYGLAIYPSPASEILKFNAENTVNKVELFDITGRNVLTVNDVLQKKFEINVSELPQGTYISKVYDRNGKMVSKKFLKQ